MGALNLNSKLYDDFFDLLKEKTGLNFKSSKMALLENRLRKRIDILGLKNLDEYIHFVLRQPDELQNSLPLLTTHKTEWFREIVHFQWIQENIFKEQKVVKIWSAACSSGEEVYSILFLAIKNNLNPYEIKITGSDISDKILEKAKKLPNEVAFEKQLHFLQKKMGRKLSIKDVENYLFQSVHFKQHNLLDNQIKVNESYDLILIRNVFIYFEQETINLVLTNILKCLKPGGILIIGLSETIDYHKFKLKNLGSSIFKYEK